MAISGGSERNAITILWRIENLSYFDKGFHWNRIDSPLFRSSTLKNKLIQLRLFPRGESVDDKNIGLLLSIVTSLQVDCEFSLLGWDRSPLVTRKGINAGWKFHFKMTDCPAQEELFVTQKSTFLPQDTLTVRCRVWKSEGNFTNAEFIAAWSRIEFEKGSILSPIAGLNWRQSKTFSLFLQLDHQYVKFDLKYSLTVNSTQNLELSIQITASKIPESLLAKLEVSAVLDNRQKVKKLRSEENIFFLSETEQSWAVRKFVLTGNLQEKMRPLKFGKSLNLIFHLTAVSRRISECIEKIYTGVTNLEHDSARTTSNFLEASCQTSEQNGDTPVRLRKDSTFSEASCQTSEENGDTPSDLQQRNDYLGILGEDLFSLYQKQTFSDFELSSGDVCFPVHKIILCARSPVFDSMFSSEMKESNSNSLDVPDLDAHALNRMLTFLYGGTVEPDLPLESAAKLYYAADKYQVDTLKMLCSSILQSQISVSNVSDILTLADRHQDSDLTSFVQTFILNHFDDVMDSKEWETFLDINPALAGKSTHLLYKKKRERKEEGSKK